MQVERILNPAESINWSNRQNDGLISKWLCTPYAIHNRGVGWRDIVRKTSNHATLNGSPTWAGNKGRLGGFGSLNCNTSNNRALHTSADYGSVHTILGWVNWTALGGLIYAGVVASNYYWAYTSGGNIYYGGGGTGYVNVVFTPTLGRWYHIATTRNGASGTVVFYVDGVALAGPLAGPGFAAGSQLMSSIGGYSDGTFPHSGFIDDLTVYNYLFSADQIYAYYTDSSRNYSSRYNWLQLWTEPGIAVGIINFDAASNSGFQGDLDTYSWSHTCTGSERLLLVQVSVIGTQTVSTITYNGVSLSRLGSTTSGSGSTVELWSLTAPAAGTHTIAVTLSGVAQSEGSAISLTGVDQTTSTEAVNTNSGTNTGSPDDATVDVTSTTNNCWMVGAIAVNDTAITPNQTFRTNVVITGFGSGSIETYADKSPAGLVTLSWTGVAAFKQWSVVGVAVRPSAAVTPPSTNAPIMLAHL